MPLRAKIRGMYSRLEGGEGVEGVEVEVEGGCEGMRQDRGASLWM